jgi:hypothetical protein
MPMEFVLRSLLSVEVTMPALDSALLATSGMNLSMGFVILPLKSMLLLTLDALDLKMELVSNALKTGLSMRTEFVYLFLTAAKPTKASLVLVVTMDLC